ncbi:unnamed protein product [Chironomus riparius]|uniref:Uncharacterized protein n=1 Tax=Chironomus riparius TaxID=315576 RepID=A0A9N9WVN4_9DIPT|nr:unnamed protein product [Chironomus riparius]
MEFFYWRFGDVKYDRIELSKELEYLYEFQGTHYLNKMSCELMSGNQLFKTL